MKLPCLGFRLSSGTALDENPIGRGIVLELVREGAAGCHATGGDVTLAPGPAVLEIELTRSGSQLSLVTLPITLRF